MPEKRALLSRGGGALVYNSVGVCLCVLLFPGSAWAIPSPDVLVSVFASAGQVLGLLSIIFGASMVRKRTAFGRTQLGGSGKLSQGLLGITVILLLLSIAANILQYSLHQDAKKRRLYTNLTRSSTELGQQVGDVNLKTLSRSEQLLHPQGISTEEFSKLWRFEDFDKRFQFIDVRTPEEFEMGYVTGARSIVQSEIAGYENELRDNGKPIVLFCESGNRSGEICGRLKEKGFDCKFVVGGFEKWVDESRATMGLSAAGARTRDIAPYPNKNVLLDTPDVQRLVLERDAIFVDVRYPGDFELGHLPQAYNIPIRMLTPSEAMGQLLILPQRPVIAPCYDKRSCFFAMILGLRLHRLDREFLGRYTVPYEYVAPSALAKKGTSEEKTLVQIAAQPLNKLLAILEGQAGSLLGAIILLVLLLRLCFLPLAAKGERDQMLLRTKRSELDSLRDKTAANPGRQSRALLHWYKQHRLTPVINLLGSLVQMMIFLLCFFVVQAAGKLAQGPFLWEQAAATPDRFATLPASIGILCFALLIVGAERHTRRLLFLRAAAAGVLALITAPLSIAVNFYLVINIALLLVQNLVLRQVLLKRLVPSNDTQQIEFPVVPLKQAHRASAAGNKAARLGKLLAGGLPVPDGFVLTDNAFGSNGSSDQLDQQHQSELVKRLKSAGKERFAVRSSGLAEDGAEQSFAGVFESMLNVEIPEVIAAIEEVRRSFSSEKAKIYSHEKPAAGGVLVQEMVEAEYAGVYFTEHPGESGSSLVEMTAGLGDALVSGQTNALAFRYGRISKELLQDENPPIALDPLLLLGEQIEELFEKPQDIEWAYGKGKFYILQSRDITACTRNDNSLSRLQILERERHRLLALCKGTDLSEIVYEQNELSEILPQPTPLSMSLMDRAWAPGGTADLACQSLGITYDVAEDGDPLYTTAFGALYVNRREEQRRAKNGIGSIASFRLSKASEALRDDFTERFQPQFLRQMKALTAVDTTKFTIEKLFLLLEEWLNRFVEETYVEAERINIAADFYLKGAEKMLHQRGLNPAEYLADIPETQQMKALSLLPAVRANEKPLADFLEIAGHRTFYDFELSAERFAEDPSLLTPLIEHAKPRPHIAPTQLPKGRILQAAVSRARVFQALKEDAKHLTLRDLAFIRKILLEIDRRWQTDGGIFFLQLEEVLSASDQHPSEELLKLISERRAAFDIFNEISLSTQITPRQLESLNFTGSGVSTNSMLNAALSGLLVAGYKEITGFARVLTDVRQLAEFKPGEILVTRFTTPEWTPLFSEAAGIVTEVGGWLSHAAILAREYQLTTIVSVAGALELIQTGDQIRLCLDGRIEQV